MSAWRPPFPEGIFSAPFLLVSLQQWGLVGHVPDPCTHFLGDGDADPNLVRFTVHFS